MGRWQGGDILVGRGEVKLRDFSPDMVVKIKELYVHENL